MKKGWKTEPLGELCDIRNGSTPSKGNPAFWDGGTIPWFTIDDMREQGREISHTRQKITKSALSETSVKLLPEDSVLLCCTASVGEFAITRIPLTTNQQFNGLVVKNRNQLDPNFLFHYASTLKDELLGLSGKTTIDFIPISRLRDVAVPVPPLAEQQRIVGLLDEAFEGIATAKANAEKNLQNARALFESHLQSVFTQRGPGWVETTFEELIESNIIGLTKNSREQAEDKAWPYVKMNNITRDNRFDFSRFTCVDATAEEVSKFSLKDGDFLFNTRNSHELVGKSCIYESDSNDAVLYNNNIMRVRFQRGIDARFVLLAFSSKGVADELNALKSGTTNVSAIYFKDLKSLVIPVPPIAEQKKIAAKLDALAEETQNLARLYERKLAALEALKKSLLHQAFTGEL